MHGMTGRTSASALAAAVLVLGATRATAQSAIYGAGLQAWLGCWSADLSAARADAAPSIVCITPTANVNVADLFTVQEGRIVGRETLDATGRSRADSMPDPFRASTWSPLPTSRQSSGTSRFPRSGLHCRPGRRFIGAMIRCRWVKPGTARCMSSTRARF